MVGPLSFGLRVFTAKKFGVYNSVPFRLNLGPK